MAKKGKYPAGVKPRGDAIQIKFKLKSEADYCYETLRWTPSPANITRAGQLRAEIVEKIRHDVFNYADYFPDSHRAQTTHGTFAQFAQAWLDSPQNDWTPATRYKFKGILQRVWMPGLFAHQVKTISRAMIAKTLTESNLAYKDQHKGNDPSRSLYNDWLLCVRGVFSVAVTAGAIRRFEDPTQDLQNKTRDKPEVDPFTTKEANAIIAEAYREYGETWGAWFEFGFYTGLRCPSEPSALTWSDVDLVAGELKVNKANTKAGLQLRTKTGKSRTLLLNQRARNALETLRASTNTMDGLIFKNALGGSTYNAKKQRRMWVSILAKLGIRYRSMYNMRHTYATFGLMIGLLPGFMANQLGHSTQEFFKTYAKWIDTTLNRLQLDIMEQAISSDETFMGQEPNQQNLKR